MFNVFKETWTGLTNLEYGNKIVEFPWKKVYKHWLSAFAWVLVIWTIGSLAAWTYFSPQIKKFISDRAPDIKLELSQKKLYVSPAEPLAYGDADSMLLIDASTSANVLDGYKSAVLFSHESMWYKNDGKTTKIDYPNKDYSLSKEMLLNWIKGNKIKIWLLGSLFVVLLSLVSVLSMITIQMLGLLFWSLVFWIGSKLLSKKISYFNTLKICIYASVPGVLINCLGFGNSGMFGTIVPLVIFAWYSGMWIYKIPTKK